MSQLVCYGLCDRWPYFCSVSTTGADNWVGSLAQSKIMYKLNISSLWRIYVQCNKTQKIIHPSDVSLLSGSIIDSMTRYYKCLSIMPVVTVIDRGEPHSLGLWNNCYDIFNYYANYHHDCLGLKIRGWECMDNTLQERYAEGLRASSFLQVFCQLVCLSVRFSASRTITTISLFLAVQLCDTERGYV